MIHTILITTLLTLSHAKFHTHFQHVITTQKESVASSLPKVILPLPITRHLTNSAESQPPSTGCTFCKDGSPIDSNYRDIVIDENSVDAVTCGMMEYYATITPLDQCSSLQPLGSTICGCPKDPDSEAACTLCSDGSKIDSNYHDVSLGEEADNSTCKEMEVFAGVMPSDQCLSVQIMGSLKCGCPKKPDISQGRCLLCGDGSEISQEYENIMVELMDEPSSCKDLQLFAPLTPMDECPSVQVGGYIYCGCPTAPKEVKDNCKMCSEGMTVNYDQSIAEFNNSFTCGDIIDVFKGIPSNSELCTESQLSTSEAGCCQENVKNESHNDGQENANLYDSNGSVGSAFSVFLSFIVTLVSGIYLM